MHSQKTAQNSEQNYGPALIISLLTLYSEIIFDGNNIIKQKTALLEKVNVFRYLVCVTEVVESRN